MSFWSWLTGDHSGITANANPGTSVGEPDWNPGDPEGVDTSAFDDPVEARSLPRLSPSPWSGWPAEWNVPDWDFGSKFNELVDVAWNCLDLNSSVLSTMPVYRTRDGQVIGPETWMMNPDPTIYTSWEEFAKQLFWDYQIGEAFVLPMSYRADGLPATFRVVPPWLWDVKMAGGQRGYRLGVSGPDLTDEVLHIRYKSTTSDARGTGPLESAGGRMLTAGVLAKYVREIAQSGGVPHYTLETDASLDETEAQDLLNQWMASRVHNLGAPAVLDDGVHLEAQIGVSPKDMAMIEIAQFTESRISTLLGVPPFLAGLPSGGDSMTYSNVSSLFDFHDRASLRPKSRHVMAALSHWALPAGESAELNRDEYSRPAFNERAAAWVALKEAGLVTTEQFQAAERFSGDAPTTALTGGDLS